MADEHGGWYVRSKGRTLGPFSWGQLESLRDRGQLARFHEVSQDRQVWMGAGSVPGLFGPPGGGSESDGSAGFSVAPADPRGYNLVGDSPPGTQLAAGPEPAAWFFSRNGAQQGPVPLGELRRMAASGEINAHTQVWKNGMPNWAPVHQVPELGSGELAVVLTHPSAPPSADQVRYVGPQPVIYQSVGTGFRCPFCQSTQPPLTRSKISTAGWVMFVVLLIACFPLCIIALFIKEDYRVCSSCGTKLG
jgi:GYF domain 2/LITAF-like zinc ribbon domain